MYLCGFVAEHHARAKRAWAEPHSLVNLPIPENLVITWPYTDRPSVRTTGHPMFTLTLLASLGAQEKTNCTSTLWSIDSYQNSIRWPVSPDRTAGSSVDPSRSSILRSYPLINYQFQMIAGSSLHFPRIHIKYVVFMSLWPRTIRSLISNWLRKRKFSQFF